MSTKHWNFSLAVGTVVLLMSIPLMSSAEIPSHQTPSKTPPESETVQQ